MICGFAQLAKRFCKFSNEPMVPRGPATNECIAATFDEQGKLYFFKRKEKYERGKAKIQIGLQVSTFN